MNTGAPSWSPDTIVQTNHDSLNHQSFRPKSTAGDYGLYLLDLTGADLVLRYFADRVEAVNGQSVGAGFVKMERDEDHARL